MVAEHYRLNRPVIYRMASNFSLATAPRTHAPPVRSIREPLREPSREPRCVPDAAVRALRDIEGAGSAADMYAREAVITLAASRGHDDAARWLATHRHLYFTALELARGASPRRAVAIRRSRRTLDAPPGSPSLPRKGPGREAACGVRSLALA